MSEKPASDAATAAFEDLRGEIALLRRCVEQLAAERNDFRPTIERLVERQDGVVAAVKRIYKAPTIQLTPAQFAEDFARATEHLRVRDREAVADARHALGQAVSKIEALIGRPFTVAEQKRRLFQAALCGAGAAVVLWSILPGAVARSLPESWHVPEWMATRTMASNHQQAGERLLVVAKQRAARASRQASTKAAPVDQREMSNAVSARDRSGARPPAMKSGSRQGHRRIHPGSHRRR